LKAAKFNNADVQYVFKKGNVSNDVVKGLQSKGVKVTQID
jgi:hypothetical protein